MATENLTIAYDPDSDQLSLSSAIVFATVVTTGLIVSIACLVYIAFKLKLNPYIKTILGITVGVNLISCILNAIALLLFAINGFFTLFACRLNAFSTFPLLSTINMLNSISILRYYMSHLASKTRLLKDWQAIVYILVMVSSSYGFVAGCMGWQEYSGLRNPVTLCLRQDQFQASPTMPILILTKIIILSAVGLKCDLSLYKFMKNQVHDQNAGTQMVPWKSGNGNQDETDLHIPIKASILSTVFLILVSVLTVVSVVLLVTGEEQGELFHWIEKSSILAVSCGAPVAMIFFTVKAREQEAQGTSNAQPPAQLQFHDEESQAQEQADVENTSPQDMPPKNISDIDIW